MNPPPDLREGDPYPGASWWNAVLAFLRQSRVTVSAGSGLTASVTPAGTALALQRGKQPCWAFTTSAITAYNATTKVLGKGTAALYRTQVDATTKVATLVPIGGPDATIYNGDEGSPSGTAVASGRRVQLKVIDDEYNIDWDAC